MVDECGAYGRAFGWTAPGRRRDVRREVLKCQCVAVDVVVRWGSLQWWNSGQSEQQWTDGLVCIVKHTDRVHASERKRRTQSTTSSINGLPSDYTFLGIGPARPVASRALGNLDIDS